MESYQRLLCSSNHGYFAAATRKINGYFAAQTYIYLYLYR